MSVEPGLDLHDWETEHESLVEELESDPRAALPEFYRLVGRMLESRGFASEEDEVAREGDEVEVTKEYEAAGEVVVALERGAEGMSPGDVASAINGLELIFDYLVAEFPAGYDG